MAPLGKLLIFAGVAIAICGAVVWAVSFVPGIGRLPGDIVVRRQNFTFYFPLMTCVILSIVATIVMAILKR